MKDSAFDNHLGSIPADYYIRDDIFPREMKNIFEPSWLCIGFTEDLKNHNDFITTQIGERGIVVQNFHGELRAFRNVCSHRHSRIQTQNCGNRPLQCPYHGWTYNIEGIPTGIPKNAEAFGLDQASINSLALQGYELDCVGQFVFIRMSQAGPTLVEYLGITYQELLDISELNLERIEQVTVNLACNWKIGMENGVEGYHLPLIHKNSFAKVISTNLEMYEYGKHCSHQGPLNESSKKWWLHSIKAGRLELNPKFVDYASLMIFPNIVTTFTHGAFFTFQTLWPTTTETMRINSSGWLAKGEGASRVILSSMLKEFSKQVRLEDKQICEIVQQGIRNGQSAFSLLGELENRIGHFHKEYAQLMKETYGV
jgi:choline monooxygenase